jgi:hypothetical protein
MKTFIRVTFLSLLAILGAADLQAQDLYFVDAHSQFDQEVEGSFILQRMDEGGVYKTILASRRQRKPGDAVVLAKKYPQRIVADVAALIKAHRNIYFLTSHADPVSAEDATQPWINMMDCDKFKPQWKQLIIRHPDRFIFAMDNVWAFQWQDTYMRHIKVWRSAVADLPPAVANALAHGNAEKLWKLTPRS